MLTKALQRHQQACRFMNTISTRSIITPAGKNYVVPEGMDDVIKHLDANRPVFTLLYFAAKWNPICSQIERDYENLTA